MLRLLAKGRVRSHKHISIVLIAVAIVVWTLYCFIPEGVYITKIIDLPVRKPPRTVVSISTFSQRVFLMRECLDSVFAQSQLPDRVIITIPRTFRALQETTAAGWSDVSVQTAWHNETEADMVDWFCKYVGAQHEYHVNTDLHKTSYVYEIGTLTVQFLDNDEEWGPGTKLIGALLLEKDPDTVIVTLDDDVVYSTDTVKWLSTHMHPNVSLSYACEMWDLSRSSIIAYGMWTVFDLYMTTPRVCDGWLSGWTGVAHHVSSFRPDIWTFLQSLPTACFDNDDMWLSAYVARQGVTKIYAPQVVKHVKHVRNLKYSLSTNVRKREKSYSCARHLFPFEGQTSTYA